MPRPEDGKKDWTGWIRATATHNWVEQDPLVDWLNCYGEKAGFIPDLKRPGYDDRFDYVAFVQRHAIAFEHAVIAWLSTQSPIRKIATSPSVVRTTRKMYETIEAMSEGAPIIAQAVLWNADDRTDGEVDLLFRSDILKHLCPSAYCGEPAGAAEIPAPTLGKASYHYRAVDIKFTSLHVTQSGEASLQHLPYMVQTWIYNEALGKTQGYTPPASYLLGRDLFKALARVTHENHELRRQALEGAAWIRRVAAEGASWQPLPFPSVAELRPNLKAWVDWEWHSTKREIAEAQRDLTLLPYVSPDRRALAAAKGITRWDDPALSANALDLAGSEDGRRIDAVLAANRPASDAIYPVSIRSDEGHWQTPAPLECFVMVEAVSDQADDFSHLPERGGTPMIYMITWGWTDAERNWQDRQLIAADLSLLAAQTLEQAWKAELTKLASEGGVPLEQVRLFHWGNGIGFPPPPGQGQGRSNPEWFDVLGNIVFGEPLAVRGALGFRFDEMARALHDLGLVQTALPQLPPGPLGTMAAAWWSAKEAATIGVTLDPMVPVQMIANYDRAACRAMMEVLAFFRDRAFRLELRAA